MAVIQLGTVLNAHPDEVWEKVRQYNTLIEVNRGILGFRGPLPARVEEGDDFVVRLMLFGIVPLWLHRIRIVRVKEQPIRTIASKEFGGLVKVWNHQITVEEELDGRTFYRDRIELHAGVFTALVWLWSLIQYRYRQQRWRRLVNQA